MPGPLVEIVGDVQHREFAAPRDWLREHTRIVDSSSGSSPRAIVLFQSRPGIISQGDVEAIHRRAPLARLLAVVGSLCEGEPRSGRVWKGVTRLYWHQAAARLPRELGLGNRGAAGSTWRPRTENDGDGLLAALSPTLRRPTRGGLAAICTPRRGEFQALADALWIGGWRTCWQIPGHPPQFQGASVLVIAGWESVPAEISAPAAMLLDFPRRDDLIRANSLGIKEVFAQPLALPDLLATLEAMAGRSAAIQAA
ncbi:MAG: hypothetical protein SFU86_03630 [Pirellulaceae bacterium]|nr:hypothetical protein [Pirellulaceae bacterium]